MSDTSNLSEVNDDEQLARFVVFSGWVRPSDKTVKPDAFIPPKSLQLSVTRHIDLTEDQLWQLGEDVTVARPDRPKLYGRADFSAHSVRIRSLTIRPTAMPRNHANLCGWPTDKPAQKIIAQALAAASTFVARP